MPEITRKRNGELVRGIFEILKKHPDGYPAKDILRELETLVPPTEFEQGAFPTMPNVRRYERIARFGTISFVKAGWLIKDKGLWSVSEAGLKAYEKFKDPEEFAREADRLYRKWRKEQPEEEEALVEDTPEPGTTLKEAEEAAWSQLCMSQWAGVEKRRE
jgi:restriction system protein